MPFALILELQGTKSDKKITETLYDFTIIVHTSTEERIRPSVPVCIRAEIVTGGRTPAFDPHNRSLNGARGGRPTVVLNRSLKK